MGVLEQFNNIRADIERTITYEALPRMALGLSDYVFDSAMENVYSYPATQQALESRRYEIGDPSNFTVTINSHELSVELRNITVMQDGTPNEVNIVEQGWKSYNQPGGRPFMNEALEKYVDSGEAEQELIGALQRAGYKVM